MNPLAKPDRVSLSILDCELRRQSLTINSEEGFHAAGRALAEIDSCSQFWFGDYIVYAEEHALPTVLEQVRADLHRSRIYAYAETARFYPPAERHPGLSFTHHEAVMYLLGADNRETAGADARKWLRKAADKGWTVGELREAMRLELRESENDPGPMRGVVHLADFSKLSRLAESIRVDDVPEETLAELRRSTEPLYAFLSRVHRRKFQAVG
jgi:hypothetical protein